MKNDLLLAKITPCFENNKIVQANISRAIGFGSTEFHVIRPHEGRVNSRYILHYLRQDHVRAEGERKMTGSVGQRRIPEHFLANIILRLPSFEEQCRIARVLDQVLTQQANHRAALDKLDELLMALRDRAFRGEL